MKIQLWSVGKVHEPYVKEGVELFTKRITGYIKADWKIIAVPKNAASLPAMELKKKEAEVILQLLEEGDFLIALEERGKMLSSVELADLIQQRANNSTRRIVFLIGGAFGLDETVLQRANFKWSLSRLVFPHQLVRLILAEQIYRAYAILHNEKYHHE